MKIYLTRLISILLVVLLMLTGCEQSGTTSPKQMNSPEPTQVSVIIKSESPKPVSSIQPNVDSEPSSTKPVPEPIKEMQKGFEMGKPKEEPIVPDRGQPAKLSTLKPIYSVGKGTVAITIDDGPTRYTNELLKVLKENDTKVTFFFLGQNAAAYPESVMEAVYEGHEIGYHSNSHPKMSKMTLKGQEKEYDLGLTKLKKIDHNLISLFRPPYGAYNNDTKIVTEEHKMNMVLWNEDPRDWSTTDPGLVAKTVLLQVHSGSIIVMHDRPSTIAALPDIIAGIKKKGLKLVTISTKSKT